MAEEYYIRSADSDTARDPFSIDKLASLAEADQVDNETLFYREATEEWLAIGANDELRRQVFPEKKKLGLKAKTDEDMDLLNAEEDEIPAITVDEMLAAAEGDTDETRHVKDKVRLQEKAAAMSIPAIGLIMLVSAFNNVFPNFEVITRVINDEDYLALLQHPLLLVGLFDLAMAVFLFLSVSEIFPMLRFRAAIGMGYFGFFHWAQYFSGDPTSLFLMATAVGGSFGIFVCTLTLNLYIMIIFSLLGLVGMGGYGYFMFFAS